MQKFIGTKLKMTSIYKDGANLGVTPVQFDEKTDMSIFAPNTEVRVSAISKGHGFAGVVKRWNFLGGPKTHGQKNRHRAPGSIGSTAPQRVHPGRKMAGRMGGERMTLTNIPLVEVKPEERVIFLNGSVPGIRGAKVEIRLPAGDEKNAK